MAGVSDDFTERLERHAAEHFGKPAADMQPGEREVAERSVRLVMEREQKDAERAAESAERWRKFKDDQAAHWMLVSGMTVFARAQLDEDELWARASIPDEPGDHMEHPDPDSLLREVAFKRKLLGEIIPKIDAMAGAIWEEGLNTETVDAEALLRELCAVWRDRPGYQHQWAPS